MTCGTWDGDCTLGPFLDGDGTEILPCTTEATGDLLAECMGYYTIRSNVPHLHSTTFLLCNRLLTAYIQENWNEVMGPDLSDGFLLAYRSPHKAVGRLAEDVVCAQLFSNLHLDGEPVRERLAAADAYRRGLLTQPAKGYRSDDLILLTDRGVAGLVESKASFVGTSYLARCLPKAFTQLKATLAANPGLRVVLLALTTIPQKLITVAEFGRHAALSLDINALVEATRELLAHAIRKTIDVGGKTGGVKRGIGI